MGNAIAKLWKKNKEKAKEGGFGEAVPLDPKGGPYNMQLCAAEIGDFGGARKVMTKWVVIGHDSENDTICTHWEGIDDEERVVWLIRMLMALGVDVDDVDIEDEDDLLAVYEKLIEDFTVAKVKVTESNGYVNMRVQKKIDVDNDDLIDPKEALKKAGKGKDDGDDDKPAKSGKSGKSGKKEEVEEVAIDEGDTVSFKHPETKKKITGEVVGFTDDDESAIIKVEGEKKKLTVELGDLEKEDGNDGKKEDKDEKKVAEVGDTVIVDVKGKDKSGVVKKIKGDVAHVRVKGMDDLVECDLDDLKFETDDE